MCFSKDQLCSLPLGAGHCRLSRLESQSHHLDQFALRERDQCVNEFASG